jgi:hypothetical protein
MMLTVVLIRRISGEQPSSQNINQLELHMSFEHQQVRSPLMYCWADGSVGWISGQHSAPFSG